MKKALINASVASMIEEFNMENIKILIDLGYSVDVACNFDEGSTISKDKIKKLKVKLHKMNVEVYHIPIPRKITSVKGIYISYMKTKRLMEKERYSLIHCHSPIGGVISRFANYRLGKKRGRLVYTAHGFHFHKTAPLKNWIIYYPIEKLFSKFTDVLVTINSEDYNRALKKLKARNTIYIPGVGIDTKSINNIFVDKYAYRETLGINPNSFVILSVGELNDNKNHEVIIDALSKLHNKKITYIICGIGPLEEYLVNKIKSKGLVDRVILLGYREDIFEIAKSSDVFAFPSKREGLGVAALEAMACGLPLITSNVHGINDYSINGVTGYKCPPNDIESFKRILITLYKNKNLINDIAQNNKKSAIKYDVNKIREDLINIYKDNDLV